MTQPPPPRRRNEARSGRCPETRQGALPPGPPPKAGPLGSIQLAAVREERSGTGLGGLDHAGDRRRDPGPPSRSRNAPPSPQPRSGFQGLALGGDPRGSAPWRGPGAEPLAFLRSRRRGGGDCLRGGGPSARRRRSCDYETVTPIGGAQHHGRTEEKDLAVAAWDASRSPGVAARGAYRMLQLRRVEAAAPRLQPLRLLRWARGCCRGQEDPEGRDSRLTPNRGARADVV